MRRLTWSVGTIILVGVVADIAANVVPLPKSWQPYLWLAWPILGVTAVLLIVLEVGQQRRSAEPPEYPPRQAITASGPNSTAFGALNGDVHHHAAPQHPGGTESPR